MESFEDFVQKAVDQGVVANAVLVASRKDASYKYEKAIGKITLEHDAPNIQPDAVFWIASCTKLLTSICALQCVQRGLITLDENVSHILPEFTHPDIITNLDPTTKLPILTKSTKYITLRHLLTHTSGLAYPFSSPLLTEWRKLHPTPTPSTRNIGEEYLAPLTFEPGAPGQWTYGVGLDWAGKIVERLNGGIKLGEYMEEHIFKPLGIKNMSFRPLQRKDLMEKMCPRFERQSDRSLKMDNMEAFPIIEPHDDCGGGGLYATARDYNKVLESILRDDGKLLDSATLDMLFKPQLPDREELQKTLNQTGPGSVLNGWGQKEVKLNHALGGLVVIDGVPGNAGQGLLCWDGLPSCFWWVDRERGTCGFYGSQTFPPGDRETAKLFGEFRKAVYDAAS